jgi:CheY-like chemotaxis protein
MKILGLSLTAHQASATIALPSESMAKILCIDDNAHGLSARRVLLEKLGHQVTLARSGAEGLKAFRREKADLVIVDYIMPQMNGAEVVRKVKKSAPALPVILLSGYTETLDLETKVKDADCILSKGAREIPDLLNAVRRLLRKTSAARKPAASVKATKKTTATATRKTAS